MSMNEDKIKNIPDQAFIPAIRRRALAKAKILTREDKNKVNLPKGSPDVQLKIVSEPMRMITREQLRQFRHPNGKIIRLARLRNGKEYEVVIDDNTEVVIVFIPNKLKRGSNRIGDGLRDDSGDEKGIFIVCSVSMEGDIDRKTAKLVNRSIFRKMYQILDSEIIDKYRNNVGTSSKEKYVDNRMRKYQRENLINTPELEVDINKDNLENINTEEVKKDHEDRHKYEKVSAIGRILNHNDKIVGFLIRDVNGEGRRVTKGEMMELCNQKLVDNIIVVMRESDGVKYLRGNGIKIGQLRGYYLKRR